MRRLVRLSLWLVLGHIGAAEYLEVQLVDCGVDHNSSADVVDFPSYIQLGASIKLSLEFSARRGYEEVFLNVSVSVNNETTQLNGVPLCDAGIPCPFAGGSLQLNQTVDIPQLPPSLVFNNASIKLLMFTETQDIFSCANILVSNPKQYSEDAVYFGVSMAISVLSAVCVIWLLYSLQHDLAPATRNRLFPRQLRSFAVAGLVGVITGIPVMWVTFWKLLDGVPDEVGRVICTDVYNVARTASLIVVLQEAHLALTFLAQSMRWSKVLRALNWGIPIVWVLGILLGLLDGLWLSKFRYGGDDYPIPMKTCVPTGPLSALTEAGMVDALSAFTISVSIAISATASTVAGSQLFCSSAPGVVQRRSLRRALVFPFITLATQTPICIVYMHGTLWYRPHWVRPAAIFCELSGCALNVLAYAMISPYITGHRVAPGKQGRERLNGAGDGAETGRDAAFSSFGVDFGGLDVMEYEEAWPTVTTGTGTADEPTP